MNGNRLTPIYTISLHDSPFFNPASTSPEGTHIQGLDYHGRRCSIENGGDFFELLPHRAAGLALCMGAVPDAPDTVPMVGGIEHILRGLGAHADAGPASIARTLNQFACGAAGDGSYATLFCASIDPLRGELRYVNAGHEPALLLRKRQDRAIRLENTGAALGLTRRSNYGQRAIPLEPGDLLAVFSEGVAEAYDIHGRPFGSAGVLGIILRSASAHAADLVEEILGAAERHAGGAQSRDRTAAVVRFNGSLEQAIPAEVETELSFAAA